MNKQERRRQHLRQIDEKITEHQLPPEVKETAARLPGEEARQMLVEERIQKAMAEGAFDNLVGQGKPLDLKKNPYLDPSAELAFDLLQNNGLAPEWIERDKEIRRDRDLARRQLLLAWQAYQTDPRQTLAWQGAKDNFAKQLAKINRKIDDFNLIVPILACQRRRLRLTDELARLQNQTADE